MRQEIEDSIESFVGRRFLVVCEESLKYRVRKFDGGNRRMVGADFQTLFADIIWRVDDKHPDDRSGILTRDINPCPPLRRIDVSPIHNHRFPSTQALVN